MRAERILHPASFIAATSIVLALSTPAIAQESPDDPCGEDEAVSDIYGSGTVETDYSCQFYKTMSSEGAGPGTATTASSKQAKANKYSYERLSGCYPGERANADFGDCLEQQERFCGEDGVWSLGARTPTDDPEATPEYLGRYCSGRSGEPTQSSGPTEARVDINDVRRLVPHAPSIQMDNGGRGIRNAHLNVYTDAHTVTARTMRGGVEVYLRGTPIQFNWSYGDGTSRTTTVPGYSSPDFNVETPTSHFFSETGTFAIGLTTTYIGEASYDGGQTWVPLEENFTLESTPAVADIFRSVTRNVADDCLANPSAWGCGAPGSDREPTD